MRTTTVQDPQAEKLPPELQRRLEECRTNGDVVRVLITWGYEHGFTRRDDSIAGPHGRN